MAIASRKYTTTAPDLRVRGAGSCAQAWMVRNGMRIPGLMSPVQSGGNMGNTSTL